jgi:hypothetical protein
MLLIIKTQKQDFSKFDIDVDVRLHCSTYEGKQCIGLRGHFNINRLPTHIILCTRTLRGVGIFLFTTATIQPPIQWVRGILFLGLKRPGREIDHSPPSSAEDKEYVELYLHSPIRLDGVVLS